MGGNDDEEMIATLRFLVQSVCFLLLWSLIIGTTAWTFGALWFDFPIAGFKHVAALVYVIVVLAMLVFLRPRWVAKLSVFVLFGGIVAWWLTLQPSQDRPWQANVSREAWADVNGDVVTLHNVRNFDYHHDGDDTPRWETRTVRLSQLTGMDVTINYWGSPWMAHPIVSFQFADAPPIAFSIETRREEGEAYSALGGLYRQFELIYIAADERDVIRARTNYRKGEDIYLYRTTISAADARARFLEYISSMNALHGKPRWYNAITANCTTAIRTQRSEAARAPLDWRILVNGKMDELLYQLGFLKSDGLPFEELKQQALINQAAQAADQSPDFSRLIREGRPGFGTP